MLQGELIHFRRSISVARGIDSFQKVHTCMQGELIVSEGL